MIYVLLEMIGKYDNKFPYPYLFFLQSLILYTDLEKIFLTEAWISVKCQNFESQRNCTEWQILVNGQRIICSLILKILKETFILSDKNQRRLK